MNKEKGKYELSLTSWLIIFVIIVVPLVFMAISNKYQDGDPEQQQEEYDSRKRSLALEAYFKARDGLKEVLKNPKSFDELDSTYDYLDTMLENGGTIRVMIDYTATNSFGGTIRTKKVFIFNDQLDLLATYDI